MPKPKFWPLAVLVSLLAIGLYLYTWTYDFACLDDSSIIVDRARLLAGPANLFRAFTQLYYIDLTKIYYRPLVNLSFALDAQCLLYPAHSPVAWSIATRAGAARGASGGTPHRELHPEACSPSSLGASGL